MAERSAGDEVEAEAEGRQVAERADSGAYPGGRAEASGGTELREVTENAPVRRAEKEVSVAPSVLALIELTSRKFCITWEFAEFLDWRRRNPWKWPKLKIGDEKRC